MALKIKNVEEAKALKTSIREELDVAKTELKQFRKDHKLKEEDAQPEKESDKKKLAKLQEMVAKKRESLDEVKTYLEENKEKKIRNSKYEYPEGATAADKKKVRAAARAKAKRDAKPKKEKKEEKPAKEGKDTKDTGKSDKKKEKKKDKPAKEVEGKDED